MLEEAHHLLKGETDYVKFPVFNLCNRRFKYLDEQNESDGCKVYFALNITRRILEIIADMLSALDECDVPMWQKFWRT